MLQSGEMLKLFPCDWKERMQWLSYKSDFPVGYSKTKVAFSNLFFSIIRESAMKNQYGDVIQSIDKLCRFQINEGGQTVLSERRNNYIIKSMLQHFFFSDYIDDLFWRELFF
jgi:hypothetical protein